MTPVRAVARKLTAPKEAPAHLRVVDQPAAPTPSPRGFGRRGTAICALVFAGLLALAASHAFLVQGQITLDALEEAVAAQQEEYHRARLEVARLESPERIVNEAIIRLGMVVPDDVVFLTPEVAESDVDQPAVSDIDETWRDIKPYLERSS